jgi:hypothetical protein
MKAKTLLIVVLPMLCSNRAFADEDAKAALSTTLATAHVPKDGNIVVNGPVNQHCVEVGYGPVAIFNWNNYNIKNGEFNERDYGAVFNIPEIKRLKSYIRFEHWTFAGSEHDNVVTVGTNYEKIIFLNVEYTAIITDGLSEKKYRIFSQISKSYEVADHFSLSPSVKAAFLNNFYKTTGVAYVTVGLSGEHKISNSTKVSIYIDYQKGIKKKNIFYGGLSIGLFY